jgi:hypothetical protein
MMLQYCWRDVAGIGRGAHEHAQVWHRNIIALMSSVHRTTRLKSTRGGQKHNVRTYRSWRSPRQATASCKALSLQYEVAADALPEQITRLICKCIGAADLPLACCVFAPVLRFTGTRSGNSQLQRHPLLFNVCRRQCNA